MEKIDYDDINTTKDLVEIIKRVHKELEPNVDKNFVMERYENFLENIKDKINDDNKNKMDPAGYFILALQDFVQSCSIQNVYPLLGTVLTNMALESANKIDIEQFCAGVIDLLNQFIELNEWVITINIVSLQDYKKHHETDLTEGTAPFITVKTKEDKLIVN